MKRLKLTRRKALASAGLAAACAGIGLRTNRARAQELEPHFLFVLSAAGGANILDSFLPVTGPIQDGLVTHDAANIVSVGGHKCVEYTNPQRFYVGAGTAMGQNGPVQRDFLTDHGDDVAVMATTGTSVNHIVAAKRSLNGAGKLARGRTICELVAEHYATDAMPLPNCNMAVGGYSEPGDDPSLDPRFTAESIGDPLLFGLGTHPTHGVLPVAEASGREAYFARLRSIREDVDQHSGFRKTFQGAPSVSSFIKHRTDTAAVMSDMDLISQLLLAEDGPGVALDAYGLASSPDFAAVTGDRQPSPFTGQGGAGFSNLFNDRFINQVALAYVLARSGAGCAFTLSPSLSPQVGPGYSGFEYTFPSAPLAYDYSHTDHAATQMAMWDRLLRAGDGLIRLLKMTPLDAGDPGGKTMWDNSLVYFATEFGRSKTRVLDGDGIWSSGHELNNGSVLVSPKLAGGRIYGDVDDASGMTFGFRDEAGAPADAGEAHIKREEHVCATICAALGVPLDASAQGYVQQSMLAA